MEKKTPETVSEKVAESMKVVTFASKLAGSMPIGVHYKSKHTSHLNNVFLLVTFILNFVVVVIWLEILNAPHNTTTEITRAIDLFTESFGSIMNLATVLTKTDIYVRSVSYTHLSELGNLVFDWLTSVSLFLVLL